MNIEQLRNEKERLEIDIEELIVKFETKTDVAVRTIETLLRCCPDDDRPRTRDVVIKLEI